MGILEDVKKFSTDIVTDSYTATWKEVLGQFTDLDLRIDPEYQRLFRWDLDQQTQFIESILLNIPSPPLFFARNDDGKFEVIDGLQRISTVLKFFAPQSDEALKMDQEVFRNDVSVPLILNEGPIIKSLEGFTAKTLPESLLRTIRYARVGVILVEKESSKHARYEVFKRLNKQGSMLSDQEIRNCSARLFGTGFPQTLRQLATNEIIRDALALSQDDERRMGVEEKLLRLLAFNHSPSPLKHEISEFLDDFMVMAAEGKYVLSEDTCKTIVEAFALIKTALPKGAAFRFSRGGFSTNLFDVVATGAYHNYKNHTADTFLNRFNQLLDSLDLQSLVGAGSNTRKKMAGRIQLGKMWFAQA